LEEFETILKKVPQDLVLEDG